MRNFCGEPPIELLLTEATPLMERGGTTLGSFADCEFITEKFAIGRGIGHISTTQHVLEWPICLFVLLLLINVLGQIVPFARALNTGFQLPSLHRRRRLKVDKTAQSCPDPAGC